MTSSKEPWNSHFWVDASDLREPRRGFFECYNGISAARSLIAICLICYQTTFVHFLVWPPLDSFAAFFSLTSYLFVIFQALRFNFEAASLGPGFVPFKWMAERRNDVRGRLQFCKICGGFKPPRAHHCRKCGRCVLKMDHHCPWIDACMGHRNLVVFLKFLVFAIAGAVYSSVVLSKVFLDSEIEMGDYHKLLTACTLGFAASVAVLVTYLLQKLLRSVATNRTEIERYIEQKTEAYPREDKKAFVWPYDLGFARNVTTTLFETTGNGFFFRVVEGTDQFTLSIWEGTDAPKRGQKNLCAQGEGGL
ncbi:hypothetical protein L596_010347 [Steinernema carpocapsae]|uniref:Palmitoyltransferase n=1 Tax=Steinernema carpocapsae TaxID=34508 RepID=A0A4U5PI21_STECR|nr:hypothetical protein L596_010347 [Steinernema carpocapsae]